MNELFHSYWWLLFPLAFFVAAGWGSFMRYKRTQAKIDLIKSYTAAGKEPPADLLASLDKADHDPNDWTASDPTERKGGGHAFLVILFAGLASVFAYAGYTEMINGVGEEMYFVSMVLGVLSLAFLAAAIFSGGRKGG
ncbi:hypothetical protein [Maricaulis sp.]|uniref:hypothetical protein n=1 Tax=Maricaulis sp. TaxID=1486257 RepID=UPI00260B13A2|nr:hypothetical protein [Maricaulis sp.]